jgi:predicted nuclease with TOPRIM domain
MDVTSYCNALRQDLTVWKAKIYDIIRALDKMSQGEKQKVASSVNRLHNVVDNIESEIIKLEKECPTDWSPEKVELQKRFKELENKCEMMWSDVSPDDLE